MQFIQPSVPPLMSEIIHRKIRLSYTLSLTFIDSRREAKSSEPNGDNMETRAICS
jgi:hypothetical protein